jgi:4-hydroxybenzoate polyprenyltransferase
VTEAATLEVDSLPLNEGLVAYLREQKARGRRLALFSAADQRIASAVAAHLGLFAEAHGSDGAVNLSGPRKLERIRERLGPDFAYAGDAAVDQPIWQEARSAILVGDVARLEAGLDGTPVEARFPAARGGIGAWLRALRLHQWGKNALVFVPVLLAGQTVGLATYLDALIGFLVLGLLASAGYVLNDLLDLPADRRHPTKRYRPFASAELSIGAGIAAVPVMLALVALYSLKLKRVPIVDVLTLAGLFTIRVLAGALLVPDPLSYWLLTFSMFLFLGLAMIKRYTELHALLLARGEGAALAARGGYSTVDLPLLLATGLASAVAANVIFVIYLIDERFRADIYGHPERLWLIFPLFTYWLIRLWRLALHGRMHEDPVLFALKDRTSLLIGALVGLIVALAW